MITLQRPTGVDTTGVIEKETSINQSYPRVEFGVSSEVAQFFIVSLICVDAMRGLLAQAETSEAANS